MFYLPITDKQKKSGFIKSKDLNIEEFSFPVIFEDTKSLNIFIEKMKVKNNYNFYVEIPKNRIKPLLKFDSFDKKISIIFAEFPHSLDIKKFKIQEI